MYNANVMTKVYLNIRLFSLIAFLATTASILIELLLRRVAPVLGMITSVLRAFANANRVHASRKATRK